MADEEEGPGPLHDPSGAPVYLDLPPPAVSTSASDLGGRSGLPASMPAQAQLQPHTMPAAHPLVRDVTERGEMLMDASDLLSSLIDETEVVVGGAAAAEALPVPAATSKSYTGDFASEASSQGLAHAAGAWPPSVPVLVQEPFDLIEASSVSGEVEEELEDVEEDAGAMRQAATSLHEEEEALLTVTTKEAVQGAQPQQAAQVPPVPTAAPLAAEPHAAPVASRRRSSAGSSSAELEAPPSSPEASVMPEDATGED